MPAPAKPKPVRMIVGLGNPGAEYAKTRHNAGFACVDALAARLGVSYWKNQAGSEVARVRMRGVDGPCEVLLAKPQAFMNVSGGPVAKLAAAERVKPAEILVVHDELDLEPGAVRAKFGGGLNAHNGLRSLSDKLKTRDFGRVRCGIGRPPGRMDVATYVLKQMKGSELESFRLMAEDAADLCERAVAEGLGRLL